ncbi:Poly(3-hydroxyalkanoate) synthetase [Desulfamplus magnetovallimortis]|uniref:Poly(3-hydroxyalkanoate) synthetase n=1 Tax=Desulfamplus magnetovallimortis TaxID=1246637 RepID=A0A1W1H701_9BACT|nr:DUF3141 domain-containing protein [Desulfamplus magnetovallimortis]SLM28158.1 Poly(3-hydroxyalkanoate) synthetase [Desulfamplus magnetovallimortis]
MSDRFDMKTIWSIPKGFDLMDEIPETAMLFNMPEEAYHYCVDSFQRTVLFWDIIRKRGNGYLEHLKNGQPPVLVFNYKVIRDGKDMERPVNFQLVRILPEDESKVSHNPKKRPIVLIDPRAGHGPGIGGSKMDSQIGVALEAGYPVYFMIFFTEPVPGQTIADVQQCQVRFLEEVMMRHPEAPKPAVMGNCQGGWAAALVGADRPDVTGPMVLNGSPLSYWGGVRGGHPMRYRGGLFGGSWLASLSSDIGNGTFDGADLVRGFEELNPANTLWNKLYNVYKKVDTEEQRFLDFEKWWGGFYLMGREEIRFIVNRLFISDELEQGILKLSDNRYINLKNFKSPILVFASRGDNITPPQQALNWIPRVYSSVEKIRKYGQVIVYMLHDDIGHLGIFVSSKVNRKEHKEIVGCVEAIEFLSPGLYEMVIQDGPSKPWLNDHGVKFIERDISDILAMGDSESRDEEVFESVSAISSFNDKLYQDFISPWVKMFSNDLSAEMIRQAHPLRFERYAFSDMNPFIWPLKSAADMVKKGRQPASEENLFKKIENIASDTIVDQLNFFRDTRDLLFETLFYNIYGNDWVKSLFFNKKGESKQSNMDVTLKTTKMFKEIETELWETAMRRGGFEEGMVRIMIAVTRADKVMGMTEYGAAEIFMRADERLSKITPEKMKNMIIEQSAILEKDKAMALETLADLIPSQEDRITAIEIANTIANADDVLHPKEIALLKTIETILLKELFSFPSSQEDPQQPSVEEQVISV